METLYRKVAVEERLPKEGWILTPNGGWLFIDNKFKCPHSGQIQDTITHYLEEIPDPTTKLKADKEELLEALENVKGYLGSDVRNEIETLIQKHKQ